MSKQNNDTKEEIRYNLKNDVVFKAFFSRKGNEEFLIDFLKALLKIEIKSIKIRNEVSLEKLKPKEKGGRLDLQATLDNGTIVNIEMQIENEHNIEIRTTFYSAKVISMETEKGTKYENINQVIMVNILDYELFGFEEYISETVIVLDKHRDFEALKGIKWYFIELPKFRKAHPDMNEKINQWLAIMDDYDRGLMKMAEKKNSTIKKARAEIEYLTGDEEVQRLAFLRDKWERDRNSDIYHATKLGMEKGIKQGIEQGIEQEKVETAKKMLDEKIDIEIIMRITGLTKEKIKEIK